MTWYLRAVPSYITCWLLVTCCLCRYYIHYWLDYKHVSNYCVTIHSESLSLERSMWLERTEGFIIFVTLSILFVKCLRTYLRQGRWFMCRMYILCSRQRQLSVKKLCFDWNRRFPRVSYATVAALASNFKFQFLFCDIFTNIIGTTSNLHFIKSPGGY